MHVKGKPDAGLAGLMLEHGLVCLWLVAINVNDLDKSAVILKKIQKGGQGQRMRVTQAKKVHQILF